MFRVDWNALIRHIDRSLPGRGLWMQCVPVFDAPDAAGGATEEGVGLAIQRESGPKARWYKVVFFRVVPDEEALDESTGDFLPGRGDETADWVVKVGYEGDHDTLKEAIEEAKGLARDLPTGGVYSTHEIREAILDGVSDPEDLEEIA